MRVVEISNRKCEHTEEVNGDVLAIDSQNAESGFAGSWIMLLARKTGEKLECQPRLVGAAPVSRGACRNGCQR